MKGIVDTLRQGWTDSRYARQVVYPGACNELQAAQIF
jgi:hypothetical protein